MGKYINCIVCKKRFYTIPSELKRNKRFCSRKCLSKFRIGKKLSKQWRKNIAKAKIKDKNPSWKGGRVKNTNGYIMLHYPEHPFCNHRGYINEHRLIMEKHLKHYLKPTEVIHHINGIKTDNRLENFIVFSNEGYHCVFHRWNYYNPKYVIFDGRYSLHQ